jgi:peptide/nickel transport system substrate-binding protein
MNTTADPILRNQLVAQADSVIMAEAPIIVLYYDKSIRLIQKPVHGLRNDAMNRLLLKKVWKAKKSS